MIKKITQKALRNRLAAHNGASPLTIVALTEARAIKNPYGKIYKLSKVNGFMGTSYETAVRKREIQEGNFPTFEAQSRVWGKKQNKCLATHKENSYLSLRPLKIVSPIRYFVKDQFGRFKQIERALIERFLVETAAPNQPVEKPIIYRNYKLSNIRKIKMNGEVWRVV